MPVFFINLNHTTKTSVFPDIKRLSWEHQSIFSPVSKRYTFWKVPFEITQEETSWFTQI